MFGILTRLTILEGNMSNKVELELIKIAQNHPDDKISKSAMKRLKSEFDETYGWCLDCDGAVVKEAECCLNREPEENEKPMEFTCPFCSKTIDKCNCIPENLF